MGLTSLPVNQFAMPITTAALVNEVFRSYQPYNLGLVFGKGLTPFVVVCEGQSKANKARVIKIRSTLMTS